MDDEDIVDAAIEAASEAMIARLPMGQRAWGTKEYLLAETAARETIRLMREGK